MKKAFIRIWEAVTLKRFIYDNVSEKLANNLKESYSSYSKYLITVASSSIGLTFAVLQLLPKNSDLDLSKIKISWIFFGISILFGLVSHILEILRSFCIENASRLKGNLQFSQEVKTMLDINDDEINKKLRAYDRYATELVRFSYIALILQTAVFFIGTPFLIWFLLVNL